MCIVDRENVVLAAVISSYFSRDGTYFPIFTFPGVKKAKGPDAERMNDEYVPQMIGREAAVVINNAIAEFGGCRVLVLAGLSEAQRTFIENVEDAQVLEIESLDDVDGALRSIGIRRADTLRCRTDDVLLGLYLAKNRGCRLWIAEDAEPLPAIADTGGGLVVVEQTAANAGCVAAVNYVHAIGAALRVVASLPPHAESGTIRLLQRWRDENDAEAWDELRTAIEQRTGGIDFSAFPFVTFFTDGLPYSLLVDGAVPCSYVHLGLFPDRLIVNAIVRARSRRRLASAVVFAIEELRHRDETGWLLQFLREQHYAVRPVVGREATAENFDYYAGHFPYDILHISSHGGEVDGSLVTLTFSDRQGERHVIEYDEVVGIAPTYDGSGLFGVQHKALFRRLDGLEWGSSALAGRKLPEHVYVDAMRAMFDGEGAVSREREHKDRVSGGSVIVCHDGYHQAMFRTLAAYGHPIVFNNTCWSSSGITHFFLGSGAVAYIGTLWAVHNDLATRAAKYFYENVGSTQLIHALHRVNHEIKDTPDANIYVYWGLHFSTFTTAESEQVSINDVGSRMARQIRMYVRHLEQPLTDEVRDNDARVLRRTL
ncbi:MAG TPA: hypothetical protein VNF68_07075, partial [Candidatus Baltobacteraceae bacterium]|nr:hypothetical protein [Candidatus Baltobacteraceae bacterium]